MNKLEKQEVEEQFPDPKINKILDRKVIDYQDENNSVKPVQLSAGKNVGFALAYCDNDTSKTRENFIGSVYVPGEDKNQGWINADIFGTLHLEE